MSADQLVPGRECGGCNACCSYYTVSQHLLSKPALTLCPNWKDGCTIYEWRPEPCRSFYCLWRKAASLDDGWRPDRSGVILRDTIRDVPPAYAGRHGMTIDIMDSSIITDDRFIMLVAGQIDQGVPVMLSVAGKKGSGRVFLNDRMADAVTAHNRPAILQELKTALADALVAANT